jgi:TP901 family phage tail tape measure protein
MADTVSSKTQHIAALDFDIAKALEQLQTIQSRINEITAKITASNWSVNVALNGASDLQNYVKELQKLQGEYVKTQEKVAAFEQRLQEAEQKGSQSVSVLAGIIEAKLVMALKDVAVAAKEAAQGVEDSMTDIGRVLNLTAEQTSYMKTQMFELGTEYGRSFEDVAAVSLRYAQAGYSMNETLSLTKDFLLALNTAELDVETGTQSLIGIMNQWGMEASELSTVIDKLNYTADRNAVTTNDLVDGLLKASSMAKTAGMSFDDTVGALTAMKVASGAAGKEVGNAFKSIMAYIQRPESLKLFDSMGIKVYADEATGALMPMMDILQQMSDKWNSNAEAQNNMIDTLVKSGDAAQMLSEEWAIATESLDEYTQYQEAAAEATDLSNTAEARAQAQAAAGVFRRNYYISLMENFANATRVSADLINSEGHSMQENSRYMETLTAKTEQLIVSLTELAVAAADSGMMDFAKNCIDTATALTRWTTESKNVIPMLTTILGLVMALKSQKLASGIADIGSSFKNAFAAIKSGAVTLGVVKTAADGTAVSLTGAATAAQGLNAALGAIGVVVTAISLVVTAAKALNAAVHEARMESIEAGKTAGENAMHLSELADEYYNLKDVSEKTAEQEEQFSSLQSDIIELLGERAIALDGLRQGTDEYTRSLEAAIYAEMENERIQLAQSQKDAHKELKSQSNGLNLYVGNNDVSNTTDAGSYLYQEGYAKVDKHSSAEDGYWATYLDMTNDAYENYAILLEAKKKLDERANELFTLNTAIGEEFVNGDGYKAVQDALNGMTEATQNALKIDTEYAQVNYILANGIPKTAQEQKNLNEAVIASVDTTGKLSEQITSLITQYYTFSDAQKDLNNIFNSNEYSFYSDILKNMAETGMLNETMFLNVTGAADGLNDKIKATGMTTKDCVDYFNSLYGAGKNVAGSFEETEEALGKTVEELKTLANEISAAESNISGLNKIMQTLGEGGSLTAEQVMELCDTYGLLASQFTETENGYKIEISALEKLREAQIETARIKRTEQAQDTFITKTNILERIKAYGLEINSLANVAEAEAALTEIQRKRSEISGNINSAADAEYYGSQISEIDSIMESINGLRVSYSNIEASAEDFYTKIGTSSTNASKAAKETGDAFKELVDGIKRLGDMGVYSTSELIDKFEDMRRTAGYTEEQIKSLEDELHKLYSAQIEENLKATEEEYKNHVEAIKDKYDADKEALEKFLDDEKEAFKEAQAEETDSRKEYWSSELEKLKDNLNSQIDASKKAYEAKKKLTEKARDGQIEALESLKKAELDNIKASFDAQIDALNKIKAARKSERSEEDYNDERSGLLEQLSYWEQRTGTEAVENIESIKKQIEELDKNRKREVEDENLDNQIDTLQEQRDAAVTAAEKSYDAQIAALKASKTTELELYESTYKAEQEMLQDKLDKDVKAMEKARDADLKLLEKKQKAALKLLEEEQEKKLKALEDEKEAAIKAADEKWAEIEKLFTDFNESVIATAAEFAPELYNQFHNLFTEKFKMDLDEVKSIIAQMDSAVSTAASGKTPTGTKKANSSPYVSNPATSATGTSGSTGGYKVGTSVKVSGTVFSDSSGEKAKVAVSGEKSTITSIKSGASKPYKVGNMGWVDGSSLVKARTGGLTKADGIAMLHKDELIINPELVKGLKAIVDPAMISGFKKAFMPESYGNVSNTYNNSRNYNNGRSIVQNFNAPIQNIEKIEDAADMEAASNALERKLKRSIDRLM